MTKSTAIRLIKLLVLLLVIWGITRAAQHARDDLDANRFAWQDVRYRWFAVASGCYFAAQFPMAWFWQQILRAFGQQATLYDVFRAFFIGHLGKYVPGKLLVVVIRSGLIGQSSSDTVLAGVSVFVETLTGMACGACLAATILFFWFPGQVALQGIAVALMIVTAAGTLPPIMQRLVRIVQGRRGQPVPEIDLAPINYRLIGKGWLASCAAWLLTTACFWSVLRALPAAHDTPFSFDVLIRLAASVCLAVVAGFVSLIPGGLGVREWVLNQLLVPEFGQATALIAAVLLRLVMLMTEVGGSIILYLMGQRTVRAVSARAADLTAASGVHGPEPSEDCHRVQDV